MKKIALAVAIFAAFAGSSANATVVDFNSQPEVFFVNTIHDSGYTFNSIADGFGTNNNSLWPSNGNVHLMSWTNNGSTSGFTMQADNNSVFSISAFDFGSGYIGQYLPVDSLTVSGTGGNGAFSQTFTSGVDYNNFGSSLTHLALLSGHTATQYTFTAFGASNRASFDNISITAAMPVPEPETYALFLAGLGLMGAIARRRKQKNVAAR